MKDPIFLGLVAIGVLLLVGAGVLGAPLGIYQAWRKSGQLRWNWKPMFLISWRSVVIVLVVVLYLVILAFMIAG